MLSTFLSQLQSYFSKYFVLGSLCPLLAFAFLNGATAYFLSEDWQSWVQANIFNATAGHDAFLASSLVVGLVLAAYVLSSLSTFLRRQLEGAWPETIVGIFIKAQYSRRQRLIDDLNNAAMDLADLAEAPQWETQMREAHRTGIKQHPSVVFQTPDPDPIGESLKVLERQRAAYELLDAAVLEQRAAQIADRLRNHDANASPEVTRQQERLGILIQYATERARARHVQLRNDLNSNFGEQTLAPTRMGNVANTIQSYAMRRYRCNLELVWSNLQRLVQKDDKAQAALMESKTQLDFLVACCWLTLLWSAIWAVVFLWFLQSRIGFLASALAGPAIAYIWYRAAAEQYRSFADVSMTMLDTFRLDLLRDMRLRIPADVEEERLIWENVDRLTRYGENLNLRYEPPAKTS